MKAPENQPSDGLGANAQGAFTSETKDIRVEIRTSSERIEGLIKIPSEAQNYCKRLSDILWYADRGGTGILTVANASVYDLKTAKLITRQKLLGVAKAQVTYFWLLPSEGETDQPLIVELGERPN
ncbi:MAG: hypothetical protein HY401_08965 [Elusimicrobia bacterium]|nr:hypothetical protein [Elusimicrobiota bacterium]